MQMSGFYMINEIYDYDNNFYWKFFSNYTYLVQVFPTFIRNL